MYRLVCQPNGEVCKICLNQWVKLRQVGKVSVEVYKVFTIHCVTQGVKGSM